MTGDKRPATLGSPAGKLFVIGIGPGGLEHLTAAARAALEQATVVVGYKTYTDLITPLLDGKRVHGSSMRQETARCRQALEIAANGEVTALISSGDAGIYGMAGLALELSASIPTSIEVIPGVSAVQAAAARLGAPLMHDFAVISLSDLLTPWELIRQRLDAAARADLTIALYNPRSRGRTTQLGEARDILLRHQPPGTPVGIVRNAGRETEESWVSDLASFDERLVDMSTLVLIGNSSTYVDRQGRMITPRGYEVKGTRDEARGASENAQEPSSPLDSRPLALAPGPNGALFIGGTGSDVGKSVITAGLCRWLYRKGVSVAPFKAQNMALNSAVTPEGGEIGRAQALQAAACGLAPHTDMNPVLLKPNSETGSQVIVQGRPVGNMSVRDYHAYKAEAFSRVQESFRRLTQRHEVVVLEGAGSIAEINLKDHDITNLRAAAMAQAPVILVADIDRGGVFASIVGTLELLTPPERRQIAGVVINRFRGDPSLLGPGISAIEDRTGVPVLGVIPWIDLKLPEEDSVALARKKRANQHPLRIGVIRLPRLSNYTDFDPFEREADVDLVYLDQPSEVAGCDLLILPGTKNTLDDLSFLQKSGLAEAILAHHRAGGRVIGICGGFQMLGHWVRDPQAVESPRLEHEGLGLLDITTVMHAEKQTHQVTAQFLPDMAFSPSVQESLTGYEIHMGETRHGSHTLPLLRVTCRSGRPVALEDGAISRDGRTWGTYLHGFFDNRTVRKSVLDLLRRERGLADPPESDYDLNSELDRLAEHLQKHLNMDHILSILDLPSEEAS